MNWLPTEYKVPESSGQFMKLKQGKNRLRILSKPLLGYEWWSEDSKGRKPHRVETFQEAVNEGVEPIKHFWAFTVWNYDEKKLQVLEVTQKTIMQAIQSLTTDEDWGDPVKYDLVITREGESLETSYTIQPKPHTELPDGVSDALKESKIDLRALLKGEYPMADSPSTESPNEDSHQTADELADQIPF